QDLYTLPCESFLYVEGRLTVKKRRRANKTLVYVKGHEKREWLVDILNS
ncbi:hypothetical protein ALC60_01067, partial [Trachymyrmex zeteki]